MALAPKTRDIRAKARSGSLRGRDLHYGRQGGESEGERGQVSHVHQRQSALHPCHCTHPRPGPARLSRQAPRFGRRHHGRAQAKCRPGPHPKCWTSAPRGPPGAPTGAASHTERYAPAPASLTPAQHTPPRRVSTPCCRVSLPRVAAACRASSLRYRTAKHEAGPYRPLWIRAGWRRPRRCP